MKKLFPILVIFILILVTITGCDTHVVTPREVEVYGRIADYWDGSAIRNAEVEIDGEVTYTDHRGYFEFERPFPQRAVNIKVKADNYWTEITRRRLTGREEFIEIDLKGEDDFSGSVSGKANLLGISSRGIRRGKSERQDEDLKKSEAHTNLQSADRQMEDIPKYVENEVLVKFRDNTSIATLQQEDKLAGEVTPLAADQSHLPQDIRNRLKIVRDTEKSASELRDYFESLPEVERVNFNRTGIHTGQASAVSDVEHQSGDYREPNDEKFAEQWYHWDIYSPEAWTLTTGSRSVNVAVIDTGYIPHADLNGNIDEDEAYYYIDDDSGPGAKDEYAINNEMRSHGTHISGLIGAVGNNYTGIAGVNWDVNIMPIRIFSAEFFREADLISAIYHAANNGADVINLSLAFQSDFEEDDDDYPLVEEALEYARNKGVTIVASAGNSGKNFSYYPANSDYTISVAASGYHRDNYYAPYSNRGEDVMAPGGNLDYADGGIISTINPDIDSYDYMEGTSQAAALVSGAAALLNERGVQRPAQVQQALEDSRDPAYGYINIYRALGGEFPDETLYDEMEVMAAIKSAGTYYRVSDIDSPTRDGEFYLERVKAEDEIKIIGWVDMDGSDSITAGDYFGESDTLKISRNRHRSGVDFDVEKVERTGLITSQEDSVEILHQSPKR